MQLRCLTGRRGAGFTLAEILIAMFLFGLFSTLLATTVVTAYQSESNRTLEMNMLRQGSIAMDTLDRELSMCDNLYYPSTVDGNTYSPSSATNTPLVFSYPQAGGSEAIVGWWFNASANTLERMVFSWWGGAGTTPDSTLTMATSVTNFTFTQVALSTTGHVQFIAADLNLQNPLQPNPGQNVVSIPLEILTSVMSL